jgi:glycosyltransferase involved in cell wall biosynthesis
MMRDPDTQPAPDIGGSTPPRRLRVLHLILMLGETNGQYNEHCLPMIGERDLTICTYFVPQLTPPTEIALYPGDGTVRGFFRALDRALDAGPYDIIHAHAPGTGLFLLLGVLARRDRARLRRSLVYTVQDSFYDYKPRDKLMMVAPLAGFRRVVFCSRSAYDSLPRLLKRVTGRRWRVVQNAADLDRVDRAISSVPARADVDRFAVLSVGRIEPVKDPVGVVEAFAGALGDDRNCRLVFIGAGQLEDRVAGRIRELGLDERVSMKGLIPRDDVFVACAQADVFISTSHGEGLPVAVVEAMAAGCPVVLSDIAPHREVVDGADFVPLVPPGDVDGFARELRRFRSMPEDERREIGRRAREHVEARFTLPIMHAGIAAVYRETMGTSTGRSGR